MPVKNIPSKSSGRSALRRVPLLERESRRAERTRLLRLLSTQHHANRGRVPLPAARRTDRTRVQGLCDLPQ
jgi:hypothetical protein